MVHLVTLIPVGSIVVIYFQAQAMWQWANCLRSYVPADVLALNINMDETSIRLHPDTGLGCISKEGRRLKRSSKGLQQNVTMGQKRSAMTHVALLCDDEEIQPLLPQYIFVNVAHISPENLASVQHLLMPNMIVSRVKNSWMTVDKMKVVFEGLADTLRKHHVRRQVVFSADAYRAHLSPAVWQSAGAHGFFSS